MKKMILCVGVLLSVLFLSAVCNATDLLVPSQYSTIQSAIDASANGDNVIISQGTYTGSGNRDIDFGGKAITVRGTDPNNPDVVAATIIDCQQLGRGFYFHNGESASSILSGVKIQNGYIDVSGSDAKGGAILCDGASPAIRNCILFSNEAHGTSYHHWPTILTCGKGGAIYCSSSSPIIEKCIITYNKAFGGDGMIGLEDPASPGFGGGIYCTANSNPVIVNCQISNNIAKGGNGPESGVEESAPNGPGANGYGGGVYYDLGSNPYIQNCMVNDNNSCGGIGGGCRFAGNPFNGENGGSAYGAGICKGVNGTGTIHNSLLKNNKAIGGNGGNTNQGYTCAPPGNGGNAYGGGINCDPNNEIIIENCTITGNASVFGNAGVVQLYSGSYCSYPPPVAKNGIKYGAGLYIKNNSIATIRNSIVWQNDANEIDGVAANVTYSDVEGGYSGTGNINSDPLFATGPLGGYYLKQIASGHISDSPCVNAGSDLSSVLLMDMYTTRIDQYCDEGIVDMGYHYLLGNRSADIDKNFLVDFIDFSVLANNWNLNEPSENADLTRDLKVDFHDLLVFAESWLGCLVEAASSPYPANGATDMNLNLLLRWERGVGALTHDVYLGTNSASVAAAGHLSPEFKGTVSESNFAPPTLSYITTYYWRIDEAGPRCITKGNVWYFATFPSAPGMAENPVPASGSFNVNTSRTLSWTSGIYSTSHDIYFGTAFNDVNNAGTSSPEFKGNASTACYNPSGLDGNNVTYYWRIDEKNNQGTTKGTVWHYTTGTADPNLVGWWKFDEGSGTIAYDSSGHNNNGTINGGAGWGTGRISGALNFDGSDDYVNVPDIDNSLDAPSQITIAAWMKPNVMNQTQMIVTKQPSGTEMTFISGNYVFQMDPDPGNSLEFSHQIDPHFNQVYYNSTHSIITAGVWQHVAVTLKAGDSVKFYRNGVSVGTSAQTQPFGIVNDQPLRIGKRQNAVLFNGSIDDVRVYNRALSASEIQQIYLQANP